MYYLVETSQQLQELYKHCITLKTENKIDECYLSPISLNDNYHPYLTSLSLIYFKPRNDKAYMLCVNHPDAANKIEILTIKNILSLYTRIWTLDSKFFYHLIGPEFNVLDLNLYKLDLENNIFDLSDCSTKVHDQFYSTYGTHPQINYIIPIQKHFEKQEKIFSKFDEYLYKGSLEGWRDVTWDGEKKGWDWSKDKETGYRYYKRFSTVFYNIEKQGIKIDSKKFYKYFEPNNSEFSIKDNKIYTNFNLYNLTTRPTNTFNGINFSALTKESREAFIPENDWFFEFDFEGYHPRLLEKLISSQFIFDYIPYPKDKSFYEYLACEYFNIKNPKFEQIQESKQITFRQLYGGVEDKYKNIDFFKFTNLLIKSYLKSEKVKLSNGREIEVSNMTGSKILNYYIQAFETSTNVSFIERIQQLLENTKTKLIHYTYDSFLFDVAKSDEMMIIQNIEKILKEDFPIRIYYGKDYKNMVRI